MKAAFQGELGSNGHELCLEGFPDYEPFPCATFEDAFEAVRSGTCRIGVMAMENSSAGRVADVHRLLPQSGLRIVGERFRRVRHQLMSAPGTRLGAIRVVRSHPMALAQCRAVIARLNARSEAALDTAGAARDLAEHPAPGVAVIAPRLAADLYGLSILQEAVEDAPDNTTRFIVVAGDDGTLGAPPPGASVTSLTFATRDVPAALYKALGSFATHGVNLLKLESYVGGSGQFGSASFYAEIEGRPADAAVAGALEELAFFSVEYAILGVYAADPARRRSSVRPGPVPVAGAAPAAVADPDAGVGDWRAELARLRHSIDNIDAAVIHLLAERFKATHQVGALKARNALPASDPEREARQLERLRRLAAAAELDPKFAEKFLAFVIAEVVGRHRSMRPEPSP